MKNEFSLMLSQWGKHITLKGRPMPISTGPAQKILNGIFGGYLPQNYFIQIFLMGPFAFTVVYDIMECLCMKMCACVHTFYVLF